MVTVNGTAMEMSGKTIKEFLPAAGYNPNTIAAVEVNEVIIPKTAYEETTLQDGDTVEVVSFVGGG